ncbi:MAG TPA: EAL domain-containing protein, partial [Gammaproteobacteria bacterium]|nr:EAL domain-containing protein [Gammaproteobacteria bacterium]
MAIPFSTYLERAAECSKEALFAVQPDGRLLALNSACRELLGLSATSPTAPPWPFRLVALAEPEAGKDGPPPWQPALAGEEVTLTCQLLRDGAEPARVQLHAGPVGEPGAEAGAVVSLRDVTAEHASQQALRRQRDLYAALSQTTQFLVQRDPSPQAMFREVCRIAVTHAGFVLAWIGSPDADGWVRAQAVDGAAADHLNNIAISTDPQRPEGRGPTGQAFQQGQPVIVEDILNDPSMTAWYPEARASGVRSTGSFPLWHNDTMVGMLSVYAEDPFFFTADVVQLITELAQNVSFALDYHERQAERRRLAEIIEATPDYVGIADTQTEVQYHNPAATDLFGWGQGRGQIDDCHPEWARRRIRDEALPAAEGRGRWQGESAFLTSDGREIPVSQVIVAHRDPDDRLTHYSTLARDISDEKAAQAEIRRLAFRDPVTGLLNRAALRERLDQELNRARRSGQWGALLFLDLDDFKAINDSLGHPVGDALLQQLGERLTGSLRVEDVVTRVGGDELVALATELGTDRDQAAWAAEQTATKLQGLLAEPFHVAGHRLHIAASIGIALFPDGSAGSDDLLQAADTAMYAAKREGSGNHRFFRPEMLAAVQQRLALEQDLRRGLEQEELCLHFQPLVDLASGAVCGAEALVRWYHPERGWVSPGEFIPVAEKTDLILRLGDWVLEQALRHIREWLDAGVEPLALGLAVNLSPRQFGQPDFAEHVVALAARHRVPLNCLKLEITESLLIQNLHTALAKMEELRAQGATFAVDDFGTGHSSLAYLQRLPLETLKIDASFVQDLGVGEHSAVITETIL